MAKCHFRDLQSGDIAYLADNLRAADRQELTALRGPVVHYGDALGRAVLLSSHVWVWADENNRPLAVFGAAPVSLLDGIGSPWLLGTEGMFEHPRTLVADGRRYLQRMQAIYSELFNYVDARNDRSIRWLKRIGFTVQPARPYGAMGLPFHRFELIGG